MRNTPFTIPDGMPLTNRLDQMTREQAKWAIRNGDTWLAYLREQRAAGVDVSAVEKHKAICQVLEKAWQS